MKNPYHFKKTYKLSTTKEKFLLKLNNTTVTGKLNYAKYMNSHKFFGSISKNSFEIQAIPATRTRKLFNPLIIGSIDKDELSIEMKLTGFDYIFIALFFILCISFGTIIYTHSLENKALFPFVFILPLIIFTIINLICLFFGRINYSDAIYTIENIVNNPD